MGFVSVFSGATNTPIACTIMGMELFGYESAVFIGISCLIAYLSSGRFSIYSSQNLDGKLMLDLKGFMGALISKARQSSKNRKSDD
jgi:H+/Cl- antiporter ClcA